MTNFQFAQLIGVLTIITTILGLISKEKHKIMFWFSISNVTVLGTYFLLGRFLGAVLVFGAMLRTIIYWWYSRKNKKPSVLVVVFFEVYFIIVSLLLWKDFVDLFMMANLCMLTYTTWQNNTKLLRFSYILSGIMLLTYDLIVGAYVSGISEILLIVISAYALYKYEYLEHLKLNKGSKS